MRERTCITTVESFRIWGLSFSDWGRRSANIQRTVLLFRNYGGLINMKKVVLI
jgi:hypothetical protein